MIWSFYDARQVVESWLKLAGQQWSQHWRTRSVSGLRDEKARTRQWCERSHTLFWTSDSRFEDVKGNKIEWMALWAMTEHTECCLCATEGGKLQQQSGISAVIQAADFSPNGHNCCASCRWPVVNDAPNHRPHGLALEWLVNASSALCIVFLL